MKHFTRTLIASLLCFASMQGSSPAQSQKQEQQAPKKIAVKAEIKSVCYGTGQIPGWTYESESTPQARIYDAQDVLLCKIRLNRFNTSSLASIKAQCPADVDTTQLTSVNDHVNGWLFGLIPRKITK